MSLAAWAALATAVCAGWLMKLLTPPPRRLRHRLYPYLAPTTAHAEGWGSSGPVGSVFGPIIRDLAERLGRVLDRTGSGPTLVKLRQANWFPQVAEEDMLTAYRLAQLRSVAIWGLVPLAVGQVLGASPAIRALLVGLGLVVGSTRTRARLEATIETRRELMRIEIYTINQLLAMRVRAGGGVIQAVQSLVERGTGEVIGELGEALRLHRAGWQGPDAFRRIAELSPEPFCARTYRVLATAEERGADLAGALLSLSEDVREMRRESVKRLATKRRAAMLIPTIAILAPVLILFVVAPLPYLITSWQ